MDWFPLGNQKYFYRGNPVFEHKNAMETIKSSFFQTCSLEKNLLHAQPNVKW
jgi:hypothetical protein